MALITNGIDVEITLRSLAIEVEALALIMRGLASSMPEQAETLEQLDRLLAKSTHKTLNSEIAKLIQSNKP